MPLSLSLENYTKVTTDISLLFMVGGSKGDKRRERNVKKKDERREGIMGDIK
jgi:hypothetical protein